MATWTTIPDADLTSGKPGKQSIFRALRDNIDAALSGDPSAPKIQSGAFDDGVITPAKLTVTVAGSAVEASSLIEKTNVNTTPTKVKEISVARPGSARITFNLKNGGTGTQYGQVYKNGIAAGTLRSTSSTTYVSFSEDFAGLIAGDLMQIYIYTGGSGTVYCSTMYYSIATAFLAEATI